MKIRHAAAGSNERTSFSWGGVGFVGSAQTDRWLVYNPAGKTAMKIGGPENVEGDPLIRPPPAPCILGLDRFKAR
jgi:hypothetical protein